MEQVGEEVAVGPVFDLVGGLMHEGVDQRCQNFSIRIVGGIEEDGPGEAVVTTDQEGRGAVELRLRCTSGPRF